MEKKLNIPVKYFKILGLTEGINYSEIELVEPSYSTIDNRFIKISNYIRTLSIYSNLLINIDKLTKYYDYEFLELINDIKLLNINNKLKLNNSINLIEMFNYIKISNNDNTYIINFGLKILFNKLKEISVLNENLNNVLNKFLDFVIKRIFTSDELFTNYNYAELKQMFSENTSEYNNLYNDNDDEQDDDDMDLFEYTNVDIEFGDVDD